MDPRSLAAATATGLALLTLTAAPAWAGLSYRPGDEPPGACRGTIFTDTIGTLAADTVRGGPAAQRVYGLTGDDWLIGSDTRATCLFGGQGDDALTLGRGGGVAFGEFGADVLTGSVIDDALSGGDGPDVLFGKAGNDVLRGGRGVDGFDGGPGNDFIDSTDGRPEIVLCGDGEDTAVADGVDVLAGCEQRHGSGKLLERLKVKRRVGGRRAIFRVRFRAPAAAGPGEYRVLVASTGCAEEAPGLNEVTRLPMEGRAVRKGQRIRVGLRAPAGRWCRGPHAGALVRAHPCPPGRRCGLPRPYEPLGLVVFRVR